ncbi:hypothetical protein D2T29_05075 [Sinirhodobacter populi]|uniref:Helix-turn-helix domain-containing protein n=1 Tax=Paenirhodobacter populi TaxID=2306993 RepID=A0A443KN46_9RHOB|nr:hypothetical protein [Sinirhodobacter populi]RWR34267.1 hypothetical protein D2T29_05075 [Sinirhodobacter populi]
MNAKAEPSATMQIYAEDTTGSTVVLDLRKHRSYGTRFKTMFEETMTTLGRMDRPSVYFRVLMHLMAVLDPVQWRRYSASEVRDATGMSMASAERALAMLEADRVIFCRGKTGSKARRLNNTVCWAASSDKWHNAERDLEVLDGRGR